MQFAPNLSKSQESGPVLITGHTGFKGTWLGLLLKELGISAVGLSLHPIPESLYTRIDNSHFLAEHFVDIRDAAQVDKVIQEIKPSVIFHLAAQPLVIESYVNPRATFETNVMGTVNLLDSFSKLNINGLFIGVTTDKVYKNLNTGLRFKEDDPLLGKDPYSASKVGTENALIAWQELSKIDGGPSVISVRAGNVIGGGDFASDRIIPDIVRGMIYNRVVDVRNPKSTRPWQHVLDPLFGYIKAAEYALSGGATTYFNFGPDGDSLSVRQLMEIAIKYNTKQPLKVNYLELPSSREATVLQLDSTRSKELLAWNPSWSQEMAIKDSFKWWDSILSKELSAEEACLRDITFLLRGVN
jgi:CDP-glucose 4,6-dehydratase